MIFMHNELAWRRFFAWSVNFLTHGSLNGAKEQYSVVQDAESEVVAVVRLVRISLGAKELEGEEGDRAFS